MTEREREAAIELCRRVVPHLFDDASRESREAGMQQAASVFCQLAGQLRARDPATMDALGRAIDLASEDG